MIYRYIKTSIKLVIFSIVILFLAVTIKPTLFNYPNPNEIHCNAFGDNQSNNNSKESSFLEDTAKYLLKTGDIFLGVAIGVFTSFLGFLANSWYSKRQNEKKKLGEYCNSLRSIRDELCFYMEKLKQLSKDFARIQKQISMAPQIDIPSYNLYPNFLERAKIEQYVFFKNPVLVKKIGECHYELAHVSERLNFFKEKASNKEWSFFNKANLISYRMLLGYKINHFKSVISEIDLELSTLMCESNN